MANKAISELPQALNVNNQDLFVLEQSGIAKKLTAETFITEQGIIDALAEALDGHGGIASVTLSSVSGRIRTYLITFTDETTTTFQVLDGTSISRIEKTSTAGLVDTYTIFMSDGTTSFFQVRNGQDGSATWDQINSKAPVITDTATGATASFPDGAEEMPVKDLVVDIDPVQSGSGDPSPDNIRPITGWTGATISHSGSDTSNPDTLSISWQSEAGTVYGGTLDVTTGVLTVDRAKVQLDGVHYTLGGRSAYTNVARYWVNQTILVKYRSADSYVIADKLTANYSYVISINNSTPSGYYTWVYTDNTVYVVLPVGIASTNAEATQWLIDNPVELCYELATPQTYQLTGQQINTLKGRNNIWANTGDTTVEYRADTELYLEKDQLRQDENLAYVETSSTSSRAYSVGDFFVNEDGILCEITASVSAGGTLIESTNYTVIGGNGGLGSAVVSKSSFAFDSATQTLTITVT